MLPGAAPGQAHDDAPGVHIPPRRAEPRKGRDHVDAAVVRHRPGQGLRLGRAVDHPQAVAQPLDHGPAHEDAALQGILDLAAEAAGDGGQQAVAALDGLRTGVHQQEATGAVGVLGVALVEAGLAEEGRLLVPGDARDGHGAAADDGAAVDGAAVPHLGQHGPGDVQRRKDRVVPIQLPDVVEHGAGGIRIVRDVDAAAGQLPDEPGVHGAE